MKWSPKFGLATLIPVLTAFGAGSCVGGDSQECDWGTVCPARNVCHTPTQSCELNDAVVACRDQADYSACTYPGSPGDAVCRAGVCVSPRCGDGVVDPDEHCDGDDLEGGTCGDVMGGGGGVLGCDGSCRYDVQRCDGVLLRWVAIPGGTFHMGSAAGEADELPVHTVSVPDFALARSETTVSQYAACVRAGHCTAPALLPECNWEDPGFEDHPVNCVDWNQAVAFCDFAGGRLPSEAEWEYAARSGGLDTVYPWGDSAATCQRAVMDDGTGPGCGTARTWPVCSLPDGDTDQGLCDMAGNVWEWQQDHYYTTYTDAPTDGSARVDAGGTHHTRHGGAFITAAEHLRAANRGGSVPERSTEWIGFRCAR